MERDFKGIWIPKEIWLDDELTLQEKIFLVEIDSLDNQEGCYASNQYFADFFGISKTRVSLVIKSLIEKGHIKSTIIYKQGTKQILKRVLNKSYRPYLTKVKDPIQQKLKDNNTFNNTVNNSFNKDTMSGKPDDTPYKEIINYLNDKTNKAYRHTSKKTKSLIKARYNEGFTYEDFITVIDTKVDDWQNSNMSKFLRPETLFGPKFEGYLNEGVENGRSYGNSTKDNEEPKYNFDFYTD